MFEGSSQIIDGYKAARNSSLRKGIFSGSLFNMELKNIF